ncbi:MAG: hypothetical protein ABJH75_23410 [Roseibium sp.]|uniref:hypothetical protein n=1 Tax=Roseibium sp. TaxID=1936156 RepID=UPI00329907AD
MVHPEAASDSFLAPLHRSFLISCFVSGGAALIVLPLHLALAGPPHAIILLVLTWMLIQWPLALFLSRSGALDRAIGLSAGLFACLVAAVCLLTGGTSSFALAWLLVAPMEAAFSTGRKTSVAVTLLCGGLLAVIALLPLPPMQLAVPSGNLVAVTTLAAVLYAGILSLRLTLDRKLARNIVGACEARLRDMGFAISEVVCELGADGSLRVLGGPVKQLIGHLPLAHDEDWLFPRLHVADRPLYLTHVSGARHSGETRVVDVRLRVGTSNPGEAGQADYRLLEVTVRPLPAERSTGDGQLALLMTLRDLAERQQAAGINVEATEGDALPCISRAPEIMQPDGTGQTGRTGGALPRGLTRSGERDVAALDAGLDLDPRQGSGCQPGLPAIDIGGCLEQCRDLLMPVAARRGILLELAAGADLPAVAMDRKLLRQALYSVLADMIGTCAEGAVVTVAAVVETARLDCLISVRNRQSGALWSVDGSKLAFDVAAGLLEHTDAHMSVLATQGQGDCVIVHLPLSASALVSTSGTGRLVKTA